MLSEVFLKGRYNQGKEDGLEEGVVKGRAEGRAEGQQEGSAIARKELQEQARRLVESGKLPAETIDLLFDESEEPDEQD